MDLIGKTVAIKDIGLLQLFYPDFEKREELFFDNKSNVIYVGERRKDLLDYLRGGTYSFINTVGVPDLDLSIRKVMTEFVYSKYNKVPKDGFISVLDNLSDDEYMQFIKTYWVCGKSIISEDEGDTTIFSLYKTMGKQRDVVVGVLFKLLEIYPASVIESSLITFFEKVANFEEISVSPSYSKVLREFKGKNGDKIKNVLYKYIHLNFKKELKLLWIILQF